MKRRSWVLLAVAAAGMVLVGVGASPASAATQTRCTVFAAASLYKAFPAMVKPFKAKYPQYKNVRFDFSFQGTDALVAQIELGATPDVFAGASVKYGNQLITDGFVASQRLFCQNKLCVIRPVANAAKVNTLGDLARTTKPIPLIAIGDRHLHPDGPHEHHHCRRLRPGLFEPGPGERRGHRRQREHGDCSGEAR